MENPYSLATKAAIEEILTSHLNRSKFGFTLSERQLSLLTEELFLFVRAQRSLKNAAERLLTKETTEQKKSPDLLKF